MSKKISFPQREKVKNVIKKIDLKLITGSIPKNGNCGQIYKVENKKGEILAVKVLRESFPQERIENEVNPLKDIDHPNLMKVYGYYEEGGIRMIIEEFVEGINLGEMIESKTIVSEKDALSFLAKLNKALDFMWSENFLVHRDIKPNNIILRKSDNEPVLIDFGVLKDLNREFKITSTGFQPGTPEYQPPECLIGTNNPDYRVDQFSLGVTLYELLSGVHPFGDKTPTIISRIKNPNFIPKAISAIRNDLSNDTSELLGKMMSHNLLDRYRDHQELSSDIDKINSQLENPEAKKTLKQNTLLLHISSNYKNSKDIIEEERVEGVVISSNLDPKKITILTELFKEDVEYLLIDPETYRTMFQKKSKKLKDDKYFENQFTRSVDGKKKLIVDLEYWENLTNIKDFSHKCIDFQVNNNATHLITPYFYIDTTMNGWFSSNESMVRESIKYAQRKNLLEKLILGVFIDSSLLLRRKETAEILRFATSYPIKTIYLLVDYKTMGNLSDKNTIKNLTDFIRKLESKDKQVILAYSGFEGLVLSSLGLSCLATGGSSGKESICFTPRFFSSKKGTPPSTRYFLPSILSSLKSPGEFETIHSYNDLWNKIKCDCKYCKAQGSKYKNQGKLNKGLIEKHTLKWKKNYLDSLRLLTSEGKINYLASLLQSAEIKHSLTTSTINSQLVGKSDDSHLKSWIDYLEHNF